MKNKKIMFQGLIFIFLVLVSLIMLSPLLIMVSTSLKSMSEIQSPEFHLIPQMIQWDNYKEIILDGRIFHYMFNTIVITFFTVAISLIFNSLAGFSFARLSFPGRDAMFFLMLIGIMMPPQVIMLPTFLLMKKFPLVGGNNILGQGGIGFINTYFGLILPFLAGAFGVFLCRQFYLNFSRSLDEAAELDGAGKLRTYISIYLPLSKPILATLTIFKIGACWNDYMWPLIMTNTEKMRTLQLGLTIYRGETGVQWNMLMAATTLATLPLIFMFLFLQRYFVQGVATSGLKD